MLKKINEPLTTTLKEFSQFKHEAIFVLIYVAVILTVMEYFLIPPRAEGLLQGRGLGQWLVPSMQAGLLWSLGCIVGFFMIPALAIKLFQQQKLSDYGLSFKNFFQHMRTYLFLYALMLPLIYLAAQEPHFQNTYPFVPDAKLTWRLFLVWEVAYVLQFFCLEFFFRGFILFSLEKHMNRALAIGVMVVPYVMIHFHKPVYETFGAIIAGVVLGHLALKYRSWIGGAVLHSLVAVTLDTSATYQIFN